MKSLQEITAEHETNADALAAYLGQVEYRRVPIEEVNFFLIDRFLNGRLRLARDNPAMPVQVRAFLGDFLIGTQTAKSVDGTSPTIRGAIGQVLAILVQAQVMTQDESDAFIALLRQPIASATLDDVARARRENAAAPVTAALNEYAGELAAWVASGEGEMPVLGVAE